VANDDASEVPEGTAVFPLIPEELGVDPLLLAVLHTTVFLTGSDETVVDPDAAAEAMEHLATYMQRLSGARLQRVREDLSCLYEYGKTEKWDRQDLRFLKDFLKEFGVGEGEAK
jgi:hypothetical protein